MKKRILIYLILFNTLLLSSCKEEVVRKITIEEQVLTRIQNDCGFYQEYGPENVGPVREFKNAEFKVSSWFESTIPEEDDWGGLYLKFSGEDGISGAFTVSLTSCYLKDSTFALNEKYLISGYGIQHIQEPNSGIKEYRSGILILDSIEKIE
ncbi:hypothetical protein [Arcticibacterium luteifluviistationis]|uniref:Lipoprotein n=1 Tax=Arcticibacterium luteifluviistationis TaxID=1784714 RepID=A0A2Z4G7R8_9BACT|nr:hypothetical protein [Arcticibacterium luteifluviistationis]AWV97212.1 hypothetical protein DJ013_03115 [Arcticibacterium luteifluviistationis]